MARPAIMPDLLVGIDFGMTYTGVAWTNFSSPAAEVISDWPDSNAYDDGRKVPTRMVFSPYDSVKYWGYQVNSHQRIQPPERLLENWKIFLEQQIIDEARQAEVEDVPRSVGEAQAMVAAYLAQIYIHIKESIQAEIGRGWEEKTISFVFSLPTTWTSIATVERFKEAIANAGFGADNPSKHTAELDLTEAEAAAVFTLKEAQVKYNVGDILLICDAGGGTTDLGLFQVKQTVNPLSLTQIHQVQGVGIGSTMIDSAFMALIKARLKAAPDAAQYLPRYLPKRLADDIAFRTAKHSFGTNSGNHLEYYMPTIAREDLIPASFSDARLGIEQGRMRFTRAEIQALFDRQIVGIVKKIDQQLNWMRDARPNDQVKYLVLSGGLGSSAYLRSQLEQRYHRSAHPNAEDMSIIRCKFPQLAVVKGLIVDKRQKLESGTSLLTYRVARRSYGVLCMEPWNPNFHVGEDVAMDRFIKGKRWAVNQIDWVIRKGDTIVVDTARERSFSRKLMPGDPTRQWDIDIVVSDNEAAFLPRSLKKAGAVKLCVVQSNLSQVHEKEFEERSKRCWQKGKHHFMAHFTVKVIISPADLKFELWFKGLPRSRAHDPIKIQWDAVGASSRPIEDDKGGWEAGRRFGEM